MKKKIKFYINKNIQQLRYFKQVLRISFSFVKTYGPKKFFKKVVEIKFKTGTVDYAKWIKEVETKFFDSIDIQKKFDNNPLISILLPLYNVNPQYLEKCLRSVTEQIYTNWELCIYDDGSINNKEVNHTIVKALIEEYGNTLTGTRKIKFKTSAENNHISFALNKCLEMATGEYFVILDNDDVLSKFALFFVVNEINNDKNLNLIYSDEDKISVDDKRHSPIFKPDWSPETNLNGMYTTHLTSYKTELVRKLGGFRLGYEGSQDFDLVLRMTDNIEPETIKHIPVVLYHWRSHSDSTSQNVYIKPYVISATKKALQDTLIRRKIKGKIVEGNVPNTFKVNFNIQNNPSVSIIIPSYNQYQILKRCIQSIEEKTEYKNYNIVVVNNRTNGKEDLKYLESIKAKHTVLDYNHEFNFSAINNFAVANTKSDHIVLLNNDTEIINPDWLTNLLEYSQQPQIGVVGAKLLYPNDTIQHAGVILGIQGVAGHSHKHFDNSQLGHMGRINRIQNIAAVTGACFMVKRNIYNELNGLDEKHLKIAFNDVDFCLKALEKGYRNIYTPYAQLYHYESVSRGLEDDPIKVKRFESEIKFMQDKWGDLLTHDPYYNINLTLERENFECRGYSHEYFADLHELLFGRFKSLSIRTS